MKLLGLDIRRAGRRGADELPLVASRRSYQDPWQIQSRIGGSVDLAVYKAIAEGIPFIDAALRKLSRMIPRFEVKCRVDGTADELNTWLQDVRVGSILRGFAPFARAHVRQMLQYGKSAGEIALTRSKRDVAGLYAIDARQIRLLPDEHGRLLLGESDALGMVRAYEHQELFIYSACNSEGDDPTGVSVLRAVPFVADVVLRMENATRQKWQRHGAPSFLVHHRVDGDIQLGDAALDKQREGIQSDWERAMRARWNNEGIVDFISASQREFVIRALDSEGELEFSAPYRALMEQVICSVELAPFMLGLQWATTERLSRQQADVIIGQCQEMRAELEPDFLHVLSWVQRLRGLRGDIRLHWLDINLQDQVESARGQLYAAQAAEKRIGNGLTCWRNGWLDQLQAAQMAGLDIDGVAVDLERPAGAEAAGEEAQDEWEEMLGLLEARTQGLQGTDPWPGGG